MSFRQALRSRFKGDVKAEEDGGTLVRKGSAKRPKTLADHKDGEEVSRRGCHLVMTFCCGDVWV